MLQTHALKSLINRPPINQLISGLYSSIWIKQTARGYVVSGRTKTDNAVVRLSSDGAPALVFDLGQVLGGAPSVHVEVGGAAYAISRLAVVGGTLYGMVEHALIPSKACGVPTVVI